MKTPLLRLGNNGATRTTAARAYAKDVSLSKLILPHMVAVAQQDLRNGR
jgi:hypothetical protein